MIIVLNLIDDGMSIQQRSMIFDRELIKYLFFILRNSINEIINDGLMMTSSREQVAFVKGAMFALAIILVAVILISITGWKETKSTNLLSEKTIKEIKTSVQATPFILILQQGKKQPLKVLIKSLDQYRIEVSKTLKGLSQHLEQALVLEEQSEIPQPVRLSQKIHQRIKQLSKFHDEDEKILLQLLSPYQTILSLPDKSLLLPTNNYKTKSKTSHDDRSTQNPSMLFQIPKASKVFEMEENAYDSATQVIAHIVRDWTFAGRNIRSSLYKWCCNELVKRIDISSSGPILVPGAGVGRLAYDIYSHGFTVEANELSPVMTAVANAILKQNISGTLHPFLLDPLANEVDSERRYESVEFPDTIIESSCGSLSFTIGDFVGDYYWARQSAFASVVTCFFIDTATNIYEYIELIKCLLKPNGLWINVGPVQWHQNALLRPSVDELKSIIAAYGFEIVAWKVDSLPVPYRYDFSKKNVSFVTSTSFEAYRPLRFIAVRKD